MAIKREDGREDEQTMLSIKNAYRALSTLLNSPIADLREQSAQISSQYEALIKCCDDFLRENSGKTENDRMRVREISKLEETFKSELAMMKASVLLAAQKYPSETEVVLRRHTDATILLTEKLFPTTIGYPVYRGERAEG